MKTDYSWQAWMFVATFALGAVFKTVADQRVAQGTEDVAAFLERVALALERAYPPRSLLQCREEGAFIVCEPSLGRRHPFKVEISTRAPLGLNSRR